LKPENILLSAEGNVKLIDFGLCKSFENDEDMSNTFVGTAEYLSPEMIMR